MTVDAYVNRRRMELPEDPDAAWSPPPRFTSPHRSRASTSPQKASPR